MDAPPSPPPLPVLTEGHDPEAGRNQCARLAFTAAAGALIVIALTAAMILTLLVTGRSTSGIPVYVWAVSPVLVLLLGLTALVLGSRGWRHRGGLVAATVGGVLVCMAGRILLRLFF